MKIITKPLLKMLMLSLAFSIPSITMAKVYKWTDEQGKTHYTATPPPAKLKTKSKEFKINKTKSSSLTNNLNESNSETEDNPEEYVRSKCNQAINKVPQLIREMERVVEKGYSAGKIPEKDYKLAKSQIRQEKTKPKPSMSECISDYNKGGRKKNDIVNLANNSVEDAFQLMAMGAALEQAEKRIKKKKK